MIASLHMSGQIATVSFEYFKRVERAGGAQKHPTGGIRAGVGCFRLSRSSALQPVPYGALATHMLSTLLKYSEKLSYPFRARAV